MVTSRKPKAKQAYNCLLQVELEDVTSKIWRQVWVDSGMSLHTLHHILQAIMGWTDAYLHEFSIKGKRYSLPDPEDDPGRMPVDEREALLGQIWSRGWSSQIPLRLWRQLESCHLRGGGKTRH